MTCLAAFSAALAVGLIYRAEWLTDWDSLDYTARAINAQSSDLLLGRWWFIAGMRGAYLAGKGLFGLDSSTAYLAMQSANMLAMALAIVGLMLWTRRLSGLNSAAVIAAVLVLPGPLVGIYSSAVMTEASTLMLLMASFLLWDLAQERNKGGLALLAGLLFGVVVDMREPAVLLAAWPVVSCVASRKGGRLLALAAVGALVTLGVGVLMAWAWYPWTDRSYFQNIFQWTQDMAEERQQYRPHLLANLRYLVFFTGSASPIGLILFIPVLLVSAAAYLGRQRPASSGENATRRRPSLPALAAIASIPYALSLLINHDLDVNPRFVLPLTWMWVPFVAGALGAWCQGLRRTIRPSMAKLRLSIVCIVLLSAALAGLQHGWRHVKVYYFDYAEQQQQMYLAIRALPPQSVVIAGAGTPVANFLWQVEQRKDLAVIGSGWEWPGEKLSSRVAEYLREGRPVFVNASRCSWTRSWRETPEWAQVQAMLGQYPYVPAAEDPKWFVRLLPLAQTQPARDR